MDPGLLANACSYYKTSPDQLTPLVGGYYNSVYRYPAIRSSEVYTGHEDRKTGEGIQYNVLRIGLVDCPVEQTLGMLDWVNHLSEQGAPVTAPIPSTKGRLLEQLEQDGNTYNVMAFTEAQGRLAERMQPKEWTDELFQSIGRAVGKMHAVSKRYHPSLPSYRRPQWFDSNEIHEATSRLSAFSDAGRDKLAALVEELRQLPASPDDFGMIHDDLHFANFIVQQTRKITIIDFDDCVYGWFCMDAAMALFDVLVLYNAKTDKENRDFAKNFMHQYLCGYRQENELSPFWQIQLPHFLKLKELCVYAPLIGHPDINQPDSWVGRFMRGRAERIANDEPYVDIDFSRL
jgi:Ser/Thr protein kinase RdoA (MazF antagonist)